MDSQQARLILACRRPRGQDDQDPAIREALEAARMDPELGMWLAREQEADLAVSGKLAEVAVPERLRGEILAGQVMVRPAGVWRRVVPWALAAAVAVLAGLGVWMAMTRPSEEATGPVVALPAAPFGDFRQDVAGLIRGGFEPQVPTAGMAEVAEELRRRQGAARVELPPFLAEARAYACSVIEWRGRRVSGVCLEMGGKTLHLFVLPRHLLDTLPQDGEVLAAEVGDLSTLAWNTPESVYVLVADSPEVSLEGLPGGS